MKTIVFRSASASAAPALLLGLTRLVLLCPLALPCVSGTRSFRAAEHDRASSLGTPAGLQKRGKPDVREPIPKTVLPPSPLKGLDGPASLKPQLFFLFMVYVKINNEEVWDRFFSPAVRGVDYQALVHCKSEASCKANIKSLHRFEIISSVETRYCFNLVNGMNALLKAALLRAGKGASSDKFIFVSDSTLPVKPFHYMHSRLTSDSNSDFCIFPRNEWAEVSETYLNSPRRTSVTRVAVKHHQWVVLSRAHAMESVEQARKHQTLMADFQLNTGFKNTGCLDEFWHFLTIYKSLQLSGSPTTVHLQGFNGGPLSTTDYEIQGRCNTFVHWVPRASGTSNNVTLLADALLRDPGTDLAPASETRPASIARLSRSSLLEVRSSPFLFVRKVEDKCQFSGCSSLAQAFDSIVFSSTPQSAPVVDVPWRGQGAWLDTRRSVVRISAESGSLRLTGADAGMEAKGSYCKDDIRVVFANGFEAEATLSPDGVLLHWKNGVTWGRALTNSTASGP
mmetsp:Transcript_68296/g.153023  ORF Transcript_68296/g.153023 Transcript_68296/m.153023 type:complete len:509 (-) Transcript_68296:127-1653(-)